MAVRTDTTVKRIPMAPKTDLAKRIKDECETQSSGTRGRRLAAAFTVETELILIFQLASDNE